DRVDRLGRALPGGGNERWRGEVIDLVWAHLLDGGSQRRRLEQVTVHERDALSQVLGASERLRGAAPHQTVHLVSPLEQELGQEGAVLTGDAGDERPGRLAPRAVAEHAGSLRGE